MVSALTDLAQPEICICKTFSCLHTHQRVVAHLLQLLLIWK